MWLERFFQDTPSKRCCNLRIVREMSALRGCPPPTKLSRRGLEAKTAELETAIAEARQERLNVDSFMGMVRRYTDITELTA